MGHRIGDLELEVVSGGRLRLDGGTMFGVVPRVLWQRKSPPDERNRILLDTNCLLIRSPVGLVLIDTGYGGKATQRDRDNFALEEGSPLLRNLAAVGVRPDDIAVVILTHLHFDHAGGVTELDESGVPRPVFRRAMHLVQRLEWEDATGRLPELAGAYFERDFLPLADAGLLELVDGDARPIPGIELRLTGGHTRGHQVVLLHNSDRHAIYTGDLAPTTAHLRAFWTMAYDQSLLEQRRLKPRLLGEAADRDWLVIFDHDPNIRAAHLARDAKEEFVVRESVPL
ncbi:MAG: MBL fold metallo-hydrolase [Planctomycetes bacterium]|nr:MBL fold metallo-hydrolase [Planctomycetota bacterium]